MGISFNALGLLNGNGINVSSVVNAALAPETASISLYQNQQTDLSTQAGLLLGLNNNITNLAAATVALANPNGPLGAIAATSTAPSILTATAQASAVTGTHQVTVSNLATTGTLFTNPLASGTTAFATGDIQLQVGGAGGVTHDIPITQGSNDTLTTLSNYINKAGFGVTASVVNDANGARLTLFSQASGAPGALAITNNTTGVTFNTPVGGTNASLTIDNVPFSSATNTVTGAIPGVTLNLASTTSGTPVQVTVGPDTNQATTAINNFVNAYNAVIGTINTQFAVDPTTNTQGPLAADTSLRALQSTLLSDVSYSITGNSGLVNLASLGVDLNNDGTLSVNQTATYDSNGQVLHPSLASVLASNPSAVQSFFQNPGLTGFGNVFSNDLTGLTNPSEGLITVDIAGNQTQQTALTTQINNLQDRVAAQRTSLTLLYDQLNATLEGYPSLLQEVTAEIAALSGSTITPSNPTSNNTTPATGTAVGG